MNPRICLLVGDNTTAHCGVKDYSLRLAKALHEIGVAAEVLAPPSWSMRDFLRFSRVLRRRRFDVIHLQYPSIGHRASLGPHFVGAMRLSAACVVTLHEFSRLPLAQRLSTHLFRCTADHLIFTAEREMENFGRTKLPKRVVHIGSNVPVSPDASSRALNVLYFGQIRPDKGIEEFLALAEKSDACGLPLTFQVVGSVPERRADYYRALRERSAAKVEWTIDASFDDVAKTLASSFAAYLPFPDGASYRRGSLLAALANGLPVLTGIGTATPGELVSVILPTDGIGQALAHLTRLHESPQEASHLGLAARAFAERFSWTTIAEQHKEVYSEVLNSGRLTRPA
jgi:glycosyltransferase involved in cell wall biosynthesis